MFACDVKGGKDGSPPDLATIFFETRKKDNKLVEPEAIEKHVRLVNSIYVYYLKLLGVLIENVLLYIS